MQSKLHTFLYYCLYYEYVPECQTFAFKLPENFLINNASLP
jgi:hypothetical protein